MSLAAVRFIAEAFLFLLLGLPLLWKRPFSMDYARLDPREAGWPPQLFLKVNYLVSAAWTAAFLAMAAADGAVAFDPRLPLNEVSLSAWSPWALASPSHSGIPLWQPNA